MIKFILNEEDISTELPPGITVLDLVRYHKGLKGTKIGCREGDCGACTILVGELVGDDIRYRTMTSCLMPLANASGKHIVTVEGINPTDRGLTPVQQAMVDESGTQCGFCTVGFVMSLTGFCVDKTPKNPEMAISSIDGNICRCTGYKSIERAAELIAQQLSDGSEPPAVAGGLTHAVDKGMVPGYFRDIPARLRQLSASLTENRPVDSDASPQNSLATRSFVSGGTDVYIQKPEIMADSAADHLFYDDELRGIHDKKDHIELGASTTVTDLLVSPVMKSIFPDLHKYLKLVSSTPIRNMATLAGNFVNASPIGDMTVWFLALNAEIELKRRASGMVRTLPLKDLYLGYKQLAKDDEEIISKIRFKKPVGDFRFNFEKISKRTYLDIATVNTAISLIVTTAPSDDWLPPALSGSSNTAVEVVHTIQEAQVSAGGVAPIPLYLKQTSDFLKGKQATTDTIAAANEIVQSEIAPISDVRGTEAYKRLALRQLFRAHFHEMFGIIDI